MKTYKNIKLNWLLKVTNKYKYQNLSEGEQ